jgi:hypothetical protein
MKGFSGMPVKLCGHRVMSISVSMVIRTWETQTGAGCRMILDGFDSDEGGLFIPRFGGCR